MIRKSIRKKICSVLTLCAIVGSTSAYAANYKFGFDFNTGIGHSSGYSDYAYKYTDNENPVMKIKHIESKVLTNFMIVNSDGDQRTNVISASSPARYTFQRKGMAKNHKYRLSAETDRGHWYSRYNVTGAWNPDMY